MEDNKRFLQLNDIKAYKVDSVSANISEGFGRYHKKDKIKFYRYSQGSVNQAVA